MNYKKRRKEIIKNEFSVPGLIIMITFACTGLAILYFSGIFNVKSKEMLYNCLSNNGLIIFIGTFLLVILLGAIILSIRNVILKPKKEVLYLTEKEGNKCIFLSKKGKKFEYKNCKKEINKYYYAMKTADYIYEMLEECDKSIEDLLSEEKKRDNSAIEKFVYKHKDKIMQFIWVIFIGFFVVFFFTIFYAFRDLESKIIFLPFIGLGLCAFGLNVSKSFNNKKLLKIFKIGCAVFVDYIFYHFYNLN